MDLPVLGHTADNPKTYMAMTFSQQVPGPTLRVTQGDVVKMTLTIPAGELRGHGNDMHASQMNSGNFDSINPGESKTFCYIAESAGVFQVPLFWCPLDWNGRTCLIRHVRPFQSKDLHGNDL